MSKTAKHFKDRRTAYALYLSKQPVAIREQCIARFKTPASRASFRTLVFKMKAHQLYNAPLNILGCALSQLKQNDPQQFAVVTKYLEQFTLEQATHGKNNIAA